LDGKAIKNMSIWLDNTFDGKSLLYVEISTSNKKFKLQYNNITTKFESMTWHRFNRKGNDGYPTEFWIRLENNRGEVYLDVSPKIRMILSMMQA
jgi:hypothetical protein